MVYSNEQMAEAIKSKDMAIEKLQAQLARVTKEKSLFSDETQPERKQLTQELQARQMQVQELSRQLKEKDDLIRIMEAAEIEQNAQSKLMNERLLEK